MAKGHKIIKVTEMLFVEGGPIVCGGLWPQHFEVTVMVTVYLVFFLYLVFFNIKSRSDITNRIYYSIAISFYPRGLLGGR